MMSTTLNRGARDRMPACTATLLVKMPAPASTKLPAGGMALLPWVCAAQEGRVCLPH